MMRKLFSLLIIGMLVALPIVEALSISGVNTVPDATSAQITWQTDVDANSKVKFGLNPAQLIDGPSEFQLTRNHQLSILGLDDDRTYYYQVESTDTNGQTAIDNKNGQFYSFQTKDITPPARVQGLTVSNPTLSSLSLSWQAVSDAALYLIYRNNVNIANTTSLNFTDSSLSSDTTYQYKVVAVDASGNLGPPSATTQARTLVTDVTGPEITNILVAVSADAAELSWQASEPATSRVQFGFTSALGQESVVEAPATNLELTGLQRDAVYYFKIIACDAQGNCAQSEVGAFKTGEEVEPPVLDVAIPDWWNRNTLPLSGTAGPVNRIFVYVNGALKRSILADSQGRFSLADIQLDPSLPENTLKVVARNVNGVETSTEKVIRLDFVPPSLNLSSFPEYTKDASFRIEGTVSEFVTLSFKVSKPQQQLPAVQNLSAALEDNGGVRLAWAEVPGAEGYVLYRDARRMTSVRDTEFIDPLVSGKQYTYSVAPYLTDCTEGPRASVSITAGLRSPIDSFEELAVFCETRPDSIEAQGGFSHAVELEEGPNIVTLNATDRAGNSRVSTQNLILDTHVPVITSNNLDQLTPSYIEDITVKGTVEKTEGQRVLVTVYVNDEPYSDFVREDGSFAVPVRLERKLVQDINKDPDYDPERRTSNYVATYGTSWNNKLRITARTQSGLEADAIEQDILLTTCGYGSWWKVDLGKPSPTSLLPRLMLEGLAQITIPVTNVSWRGSLKNGTITRISVTNAVPLSDKDQKKYDNDWVAVQYTPSIDKTKGFVQINVKNLRSADLVNDKEPTNLELENALSDHRLEKDCIVPGFGCVRIPLLMEIDFTYPGDEGVYASKDRLQVETGRQKQCWDVEVMIDRRVPSDKIPEEFLKNSIEVIDSALDGIRSILKPLNAIKQALFYGCAASMVYEFVLGAQESLACEFNEAVSLVAGQGKWEMKVAQAGLCDQVYATDDDARTNCKSCEDSIRSRMSFESTLRTVCDRIFCPSAPTFQKYVKDQSKAYAPKAVTQTAAQPGQQQIPEPMSDCAYGSDPLGKLSYTQIARAYDDYKKNKDQLKNECEGPHVPNEKCCVYEYLTQWDSACLLMDEAKESKCLARQETDPGKDDPECGTARRLWNAVAGFCEADGTKPADLFATGDRLKSVLNQIQPGTNFVAGSSESNAFFRFIDQAKLPAGLDAKAEIHYAEIGHVTDQVSSAVGTWDPGQTSKVSSQRVFEPEKPGNNVWLFKISTKTTNELKNSQEEKIRQEFIDNYKQVAYNVDNNRALEVYRNVQNFLGVSNKEYIVDPSSGILRSLQCACLPGITSYLGLWAKILDALKLCLQTVLTTGDGNAGVCQAVVSQYVCDLAYDLISCFTKKYGETGSRKYSGTLGDYFGALTSGGEKVAKSVEGRYGTSSLWQSMFAEHRLVNSACLYAFTGTWDFDVNAILEEDVSIDIESVVMPFPCERRFISFNPVSNPAGITTHNYHVAMAIVAGSELTYEAKLVCSDDYSCDTKTGQCDCATIGKQERFVRIGSGEAQRGEVIDDEVFENIEAPYRFDKMVVKWQSKDSDKSGITECKVRQRGGDAPVFCQQDVVGFRCILGQETADSLRFFSEPVPLKEEYYVNDRILIDMRLIQEQPKLPDGTSPTLNKYTKYLMMTLTNQQGAVINSWGPYPFNGNGVQDITTLPNHVVREEDFKLARNEVTINVNSPQSLRTERRGKPDHDIYVEIKGGQVIKAHYLNETGGPLTGAASTPRLAWDSPTLLIIDDVIFIYFKEPVKDATITVRNLENRSWQPEQTWNLNLKFFRADDLGQFTEQQVVTDGRPLEANVKIKARMKQPTTIPTCPSGKVEQTVCLCGQQGTVDVSCVPGFYCVELPSARKCVNLAALPSPAYTIQNPRVAAGAGGVAALTFDVTPPADLPLKDGALKLEADNKFTDLRISGAPTGGKYTLVGSYPVGAPTTPGTKVRIKIYDLMLKEYTIAASSTAPFALT